MHLCVFWVCMLVVRAITLHPWMWITWLFKMFLPFIYVQISSSCLPLELVSIIQCCAHAWPPVKNISSLYAFKLGFQKPRWWVSDLGQHLKYDYMRNLSWFHSYGDVFWTWYVRELRGILWNSQVICLLPCERRHRYPVSFSTLDDCADSQGVIRKQHTASVKGKFPLYSLESDQ